MRGPRALIGGVADRRRGAMAVAVTRKELGAVELRREAGRCRDARAARRMLALALVLEGASREEAARAAGMDRRTLRDWVHRYNEEGLPGLHDRRRPGPAPAPEGRRGGAGGVQEGFAELVREALPERARGRPVEVWFLDEARVGRQGTLTRVWARRGTRPRAPRDRRHAWAYLFGAVCPERAVGAALVLPCAGAEATGLHLAEIGRHVAPGAHGVVVLDRAGWHGAGGLAVPENLTLLPLPSYAPELNPVENVWEYLRQNKLGHRVWEGYEAIVATCCEAWNWLAAAPDRLASITRREWAKPVIN